MNQTRTAHERALAFAATFQGIDISSSLTNYHMLKFQGEGYLIESHRREWTDLEAM
jgi:hypothetical protein